NDFPCELLRLPAHLVDHVLAYSLHARPNLIGGEFVNRIDRDHILSASVHLGVEARRAGGAIENPILQIAFRKGEDPNVFIERSPPRKDVVELDGHGFTNFSTDETWKSKPIWLPTRRSPEGLE